MEKGEDPYKILGVPHDATDLEIKKQYRKLALKYHPDKQTSEEDKARAHDIFAKLSEAYDTVSDPVKRYDWRQANEKRAKAKKAAAHSPQPQRKHRPPPPPNAQASKSPRSQPSKNSQPSPAAKKHPPPPPRPGGPGQMDGGSAKTKKAAAAAGSMSPGPLPTKKAYRDPFAVFDSVMKEEYGEHYKEEEKSGWKDSLGVPGLARMAEDLKNFGIGVGGQESSKKEFKKLDVNKDKTLSHGELKKYIESHADLWRMLGESLHLSVTRCIEVATDVAFSLALGENVSRPKYRKADRELTEKEFTYFHKTYVLDPKGTHEFFLRTIFSTFDANGDGVLNRKEMDKFLDIFYKATGIFKGSKRLPPKKQLLNTIHQRLDTNKNNVLEYDEIRDLLKVAAVVSCSETKQ